MGNVELQTAYYGRRPNCIRVYDKVAEWRKEYAARKRGAGETEFPALEAIYGWPESGRILTRVERQIGGGRVPAAIRRLGAMPKVLPSFNPFAAVELTPDGNAALPDPVARRRRPHPRGLRRNRSLAGRRRAARAGS